MPVQTHPQGTLGAAIESKSTSGGASSGNVAPALSSASEVAEARRVADVASILAAEHEQLLADTTCYRLICPRSSVKKEAEAKAAEAASGDGEEGAGKSAAAEGSTEADVKPASFCGSQGMFRFATSFDIFLYVLAIIGAVANGAIQPLFAVLFGDLINALTGNGGPNALTDAMNWVALLFVILGVAAFFASFLQKGFTTLAAERQVGKARHAFMAALLRQDVAYFETEQDPAEIATRLTEETMTYSKGIDENIGLIVQHVGATLVGLGVAFYYSWDLALVMFALFPLIVAPTMIMKNGNESEQVLSSRSYARAGSAATESISNIRTVVSFNGQEAEARRYNKQLSIAELVSTRAGRVIGLGMGVMWFVMIGCYAVAIVYGATRIRASRAENPLCAFPIQGDPATADCYTAGTLMTALFAVLIGSSSIGMAAPSISAVGKAAGAAAKIFAVIDRESPINPASDEGLVPTHKIHGKIEFKNVSFAYPSNKDRLVLKNFSAVIEPGQTLALVGESGSGKSTIVQLLLRFYDPDEGTVLLDDKDVREYNVGWLRSQMGLVSQEPSLFATSIEENIALGMPGYESNFGEVTGAAAEAATAEGIEVHGGEAVDGLAVLDAATRTAVIEASKAASVHGFASDLPRGYRTRVGERGGQLSGGQKQRVAIARALIRKPTIFIGDEATSALDSKSEKEVKKAMDKLLRGSKAGGSLTSVLIAHRLSTITNADRILVLSNGTIIEDGTHDSLMSLKRAYYNLAASQGIVVDPEAATAAAAASAALAAAAAGMVGAAGASIGVDGADLEHQRSRASSTGSAGSRDDAAASTDDLTAIRSRIERSLAAKERLPIDRLFFAIMETATTSAGKPSLGDVEAGGSADLTIVAAGSEIPLLSDEPRVLLLQSSYLEMSLSEKRALLAWWAGEPLAAVVEAEGKVSGDIAGALALIKGKAGPFKLLPESTNMVSEAKDNKTKIWNARPVVDASQHIMYVPPCRSRNDMLGAFLSASAPPVPFARLWAYQSGDVCTLVIAAISSIFNGLLMPAYALGLSDMITELSKTGDEFETAVLTYGLFFLIMGVIALFSQGIGILSFVTLGAKLTTRLRKDTYTALMKQEVGYFDYPFRSTGQLTGRLSTDASLVKAMVGERLGVVISSVISLIGGLVIAFEATWQLSLIVLALVPALGFANYIEMQLVTGFSTASKDALEGSARIASEAMLGVRTVTGLGMQRHVLMSFSRSLEGPRRNAVRAGMVGGATMGLSQFINYGFAFAIVFWVGGLFVADGTILPGAVFRSFFGLSFGVAGAAQASALSGDVGKAQAATRSIFALIDRIPKIATTTSSSAITVASPMAMDTAVTTVGPARAAGAGAASTGDGVFRPRIEFKNVTFSYPARPEAVALKNFSAVFEAGSTVGLVGPSGSGKSTIVQLLMRFYDPDEGTILVDGKDIREYDVAWLRDRMGLVGQEPVLFSDSIYYNIAYGREGGIANKPVPDLGLATDTSVPAETMKAVEAAATSAFAHEFISKKLPLGYTTFAGVQGSSRLSGGQKQRVAIARALIRDPAIFVGDEATSALDSQSEKEVQRALDAMLEETRAKSLNRTSVFVAHRLSTIRASDAICVLRDGRLVELGNHDELLSKGGLYKTLAEAQHMLSSSAELTAAAASADAVAAEAAAAEAIAADIPSHA